MKALSRRLSAFAAVAAIGLVTACGGPQPAAVPHSPSQTLSAEDHTDIAAALAQSATNLGITDPQQVDVVRVVPAADYFSTQVACLHDQGFDGAALSAGGNGVEIELAGASQLDAYNLATYTCRAKYPKDPAQDESRMTREQKLIAYDYLTTRLVECLTEHGYTIRDIPTQETFLGSWDTGAWNPYAQLASVATPDDVLLACPQDTPPELIWGK